MRAVVQRVERCRVTVDGNVTGQIEKGILVLVGFLSNDGKEVIDYMLNKITGLRIFEDTEGKMNLSVTDIKGGILIVPNFTLYGDARKGKRPSYASGAAPDVAREIYSSFVERAKEIYEY